MFTEDDSALTVAQQITFRGLITYKPVAYKKWKCIARNETSIWSEIFFFLVSKVLTLTIKKQNGKNYTGHGFKQPRMSVNSLLETGAMPEV